VRPISAWSCGSSLTRRPGSAASMVSGVSVPPRSAASQPGGASAERTGSCPAPAIAGRRRWRALRGAPARPGPRAPRRQRGESHQVTKQHRTHPPLRHQPVAPDAAEVAAKPLADAGATSDSACPQAMQNRFPGTVGSPHDGHPAKAAPQSPQNRAPAITGAPHRPHAITRQYYAAETQAPWQEYRPALAPGPGLPAPSRQSVGS
jgi:hypothetical protein